MQEFQVLRVLGSTLRMKAQVDSSSRGWKDLICREGRERLHGGMQGDLETGGPLGQVGNWVFIANRVEMSLSVANRSFLGRRSVSLVNYHLLEPPAVCPSLGL
jgi:hypothetical protein